MNNNQRFAAEIITLLCLGGTILVKAAPQATEETIRARRFEVIGKDGKVRVEIGVDKEDAPRLRLLDNNENERAVLELSPDGSPKLALNNGEKGATVSLDVDNRAAGLSIYGVATNSSDGSANRVVGLHVYKSKEAELSIADSLLSPSGHVYTSRNRLAVGVDETDSTFFTLASKKQGEHINARVSTSGQASLVIYDKNNRRLWSIPK